MTDEQKTPERVTDPKQLFRLTVDSEPYHGFRYYCLGTSPYGSAMAVASVNLEVGDWTVYIGASPGKNHDSEWYEVRLQGDKTSEALGTFLFPDLAETYRWRD